MPLVRTCPICEKEFHTYPSVDSKYCSRQCAFSSKHKRTTTACETCGNTFTAHTTRNRRFCSAACYGAAKVKARTTRCSHCKLLFQAEQNNRKFCSHACYSANKRNRVERICEHCGNTFEIIPAELRKNVNAGRFCTRACYLAASPFRGEGSRRWKGGERRLTCDYCAKHYNRPLTWGNTKYRYTFCSGECRVSYMREHPDTTPNWKGGVTPQHQIIRQSAEYKEWRKQVLQRDHYACQVCSKRGGHLTAHHLWKFSEFPHLRFSINNGLTLCRDCHLSIKGKEYEFLASLGLDPKRPPLF